MVCHARHRAERATHVLDEHRRLREPARAVRLADHDSDRVRTDARERVLGARAVRRVALDVQPHMSTSSTFAESTRDGAHPSSCVAVWREPHARRRASLEPRGRGVDLRQLRREQSSHEALIIIAKKVYKVVVCVCLLPFYLPPSVVQPPTGWRD